MEPREQAAIEGSSDAGRADEDLWAEVAPEPARRLVVAAVESFANRGYHATTTREISQRAGMSPAALYVHYASKEALLFHIARLGHDAALKVITDASTREGDPAQRLRDLVRSFTIWHARHLLAARVCNYQLAALSPEHFEVIAEVRRRINSGLQVEIVRGVKARAFVVPDVPGAALAILSLGIDVARWFPGGGHHSAESIGELYADMALRMLGRRGPDPVADLDT